MAVDKVTRRANNLRSSSVGGSSPDPSTAVNVNAALWVNDIAVLGPQQAAISNTTSSTANGTNTVDAGFTVNAILVALRAHGLIAS